MEFSDRTLGKRERLKSRKAIAELFKGGKSAKAYPIRLVYRLIAPVEGEPPVRMGFVASKRSFRRAPDRNFIKRRMREAYRLGKAPLYDFLAARGVHLEGMLIFTGRELPDQALLHRSWRKLLRRLDPDSSP